MVLLESPRSLSVTSALPLGESHHGRFLNKFQSFVKILVIYQSFHDLESRGFDIRMESLSSKILSDRFIRTQHEIFNDLCHLHFLPVDKHRPDDLFHLK